MLRRAASLAVGLVVGGGGLALPAAAAGARHHSSTALVGTFKLDPGSCVGSTALGSYFRLGFPERSGQKARFFFNPDSPCSDKSYTVLTPGTAGGLVTGHYQPDAMPPFSSSGSALADAIVQPQSLTAIMLSVATNAVDPQTGQSVPPPRVTDSNGRLSGQLEAWSMAWREDFFNQGTPKPGKHPAGMATPLRGLYNASNHAFVLTWTSRIAGGPFNGFTGVWTLEGSFVPAPVAKAPKS